jgi:predicted RNase H-like HicB family nuclease
MKDYHINVFFHEKSNCWVADLPDFHYCSALGDTPLEAIRELEIAKSLWLEVAREKGMPIPEPRYRPAIYTLFNMVEPIKVSTKKPTGKQKAAPKIQKKRSAKQLEATL